jgi:hypothetical protein
MYKCVCARAHTHTHKHMCFQLCLLYISCLQPLYKKHVMQFWSRKNFPYFLWLSDYQVIVRNWHLHFKMKPGHIWIFLALIDKKFRTFTISSICSAFYWYRLLFFLKIAVVKFVVYLKVNNFTVPYMIWCRNINL